MPEYPNFLLGEQCCRCKGPILNESHQKTTFHEESLDYVSVTVFPCYACGLEQVLEGFVPHYVI